MKVWVDGNELATRSLANLEEVLKEVSKDQEKKDRVLWTVKLNGERYDEKIPHHARQIKVSDINTLEIGTVDQGGISNLFIENSELILQTLRESTGKIAQVFRNGNVKEANRHYLRFLETYHCLIYMVKMTGDSHKPGSKDATNDMTRVREKTPLLEKLLQNMLDAQENEDWVMLADLLEYEVGPQLAQWQEEFWGRREPHLEKLAVMQ